MADVSFVRTDMLPEQAPPPSTVGAIGWLRENLFNGIWNSILTVLVIGFILMVLGVLVPWLISPTAPAASLNECRELLAIGGRDGHFAGACWGVIRDRWVQLLFGFYPPELYWRPILAFILLIVAIAPVLFTSLPRKMLIFSALFPFFFPWMLWGGNVWVPILVILGPVLAYIAFRLTNRPLGSLAAQIIAGATVVLWWWLAVAGINTTLNATFASMRMDSVTAGWAERAEALPEQIAALEARVEELQPIISEGVARKDQAYANVEEAHKIVHAAEDRLEAAERLVLWPERLENARADAEEAALAAEDATDETVAQAIQGGALKAFEDFVGAVEQAELSDAHAALAPLLENAQADGSIDAVVDQIASAISGVAEVEVSSASAALAEAEEAAASVRSEFGPIVDNEIDALRAPRDELTALGGQLAKAEGELSEFRSNLQAARQLPSWIEALPGLEQTADELRSSLPDSVADMTDLAQATSAGVSSEDRQALDATLEAESAVVTTRIVIRDTQSELGRIGLRPVESRSFGGFMLSITIGIVAIACSLPIGIVLALGRQSDLLIVKALCVGFIEFIRGVPLITLLFVANSLLNIFMPPGTDFDIIMRVMIMVTLFASAYMAEVIRGGLAALPKGQYEGADSLGLDYWQSQRLIIMPQALKISIPGIVSTFIGVFKDTVLVSVIALLDPLGLSNGIRADAAWNGIVWELYGFIALLFFVFCFSMSRYSMYLERKLKTGH